MQHNTEEKPPERLSQKQKEQYRSYIKQKIDETLVEQVDMEGRIFRDKKLQPRCKFIKTVKLDDQENIRGIVARHPYKK
tara:strand:+ start:246 stop:482 length:237 start_codon:yes stop_codon:yes gene_type:complete